MPTRALCDLGGGPDLWLPPPPQVYAEGTHFLIPGIERAIVYDVRARPNIISSDSGSRDLQMVKLGLRVLTKPNATRLPEMYRRLGTDYSERVLPSLIHEVNPEGGDPAPTRLPPITSPLAAARMWERCAGRSLLPLPPTRRRSSR